MAQDVNSSQAGFYQSSDANNPSVTVYKGKNQFPQSFQHPSTTSYGVVDPVGVARCEPGDVFPYKFVTDLNTFTMSSPMKSKVNMYSAAFKVPLKAIYPRNWDIMYPIPNKGNDVPDDTRCLFDLYKFLYSSSLSAFNLISYHSNAIIEEDSTVNVNTLNYIVRSVFMLESIFSDGSLFSKLNMHFCSALFYIDDSEDRVYSFDDFFDLKFIPWLRSIVLDSSGTTIAELKVNSNGIVSTGNVYTVVSDDNLISIQGNISFVRLIELLRSGEYIFKSIPDVSSSIEPLYLSPVESDLFSGQKYNIESVIAYQLACAHFFNNPKIDYVYSSDLYRDNMESILRIVTEVESRSDEFPAYFRWNSLLKMYDLFSDRILNYYMFNPFNYFDNDFYDSFIISSSFWINLFGFQNSLRYGDYFTGAHPQMLAVGDINAPVIDGTVNALDMTRKLQITRLLNKVNISGPRMQDYVRALFGGSLPEAPDDVPIRLSKESFDVSGFEVNNTGDAQLNPDDPNITTTNLRLDDSRYMFTANIDSPCWLVFVQYFDSHRIYSKTMDRFAFHKTRFDDYIPDLQFVGDQDIKPQEIDTLRFANTVPFGYNLRYMEYKQRYSYASGAFIRRLRSWAMVTDNLDGNPAENNISPSYIRSSPSEFDRFYKSLSGYSLGTRYHFMTFNTNVCAPWRQMVYAPEILA